MANDQLPSDRDADINSATQLTVIIDLSPRRWKENQDAADNNRLTLEDFLLQILIFVNSHLAGQHENTVALIGALPGRSVVLYPEADAVTASVPRDSNTYHPFRLVDTSVIASIRKLLSDFESEYSDSPASLVGAITKALCHHNRILKRSDPTGDNTKNVIDSRIVVLSVSPDVSSAYIATMNSVFAAQKLRVKIDVCKLFGEDAVFLQQAAHLTGGSYITLQHGDALLQYLSMCFLAGSTVRSILHTPTQEKVDLRAACFCHKNVVDIGYVCSVCLSIFCSPVPICSTCRTKFPMKTLQRLRLGAKRPATNGKAPAAGSSRLAS